MIDGDLRPAPTRLVLWTNEILLSLRLFGVRGWLFAIVAAAITLVLVGVPTDIIDTSLFTRMTPVRLQDYAIWGATAGLVGLIGGTFAVPSAGGPRGLRTVSGGFLSYLAVGCPICNKVVVLLLGTSGALSVFAPLQLYLGLASLVLLGWALHLRARTLAGRCAVRPLGTESI